MVKIPSLLLLFLTLLVTLAIAVVDQPEIESLRITTEEVEAGDELMARMTVDVQGLDDEMKISATIQELGIRSSIGWYDPVGRHTKQTIFLEIPEDTEPGTYWVRFHIKDDEGRTRVKYRPVEII